MRIAAAIAGLVTCIAIAADLTSVLNFTFGKNLPEFAGAAASPSEQPKVVLNPTIVVTVNQVTQSCAPSSSTIIDHVFQLSTTEYTGVADPHSDASAQFVKQVHDYLATSGKLYDVITTVEVFAGTTGIGDSNSAMMLAGYVSSALAQSTDFQRASFQQFFEVGLDPTQVRLRIQLYALKCTSATPTP